jgi:hypothetical protein
MTISLNVRQAIVLLRSFARFMERDQEIEEFLDQKLLWQKIGAR